MLRYAFQMEKSINVTYFARTDARATSTIFGIKNEDRFSHTYILGKTGTGKSTLIETLALADIQSGKGLCVIDPHGDLAERLIARIPSKRKGNLIYFDAPSITQPYGYNPIRKVAPKYIPLAVSGLMEALKKLFDDAWGVRMEHILRNALYALIEYGGATLPDVLVLLSDKDYRKDVLRHISNQQVKKFWEDEYLDYNPRYRQEAISPIQNKIGAFLADPRLYRIFTSAPIDLHCRKIMDEGKILIVNLSKGKLGDDSAGLLGALLVTTLGLAGLSRADGGEEERKDFFMFVDEFQTYTTLSVATMISELRKFRVGLIFANQHLHQLDDEVKHAVLGNAGTLISFRVGVEDARILAREFEPSFMPYDLINLPNYSIYLKLMIDGTPSRPFSAVTLPPPTFMLD